MILPALFVLVLPTLSLRCVGGVVHLRLLIMLLRYGLTWLVAVMLGSDRPLLLCRVRIAGPRILPLVDW